MKNKATAEPNYDSKEQLHLQRMLDLCWVRIQDRFKKLSPAYRFFDINFNNRVSFNEFILGMENLKVKLSSRD
jgi:Ca2+-binding EF-hand superfamily protein